MLVAEKWESVTISANTPNGPMFVTILDDDEGRPFEVIIHAGKAGGAVAAWAAALSRSLTRSLKSGAGVNDLIEDLSNTTTDATPVFQLNGSVARSGIEGLVYCLMEYRRMKFRELRETLGGGRDDDDDFRPARLVR